MDSTEREALRARNETLRAQVDSMLETFEQQRRGLADAQAQLAAARIEAWSADKMVRVVTNAAGIPLEVHLDPDAFKRSTPDKLGKSMAEAAQSAARQAVDQSQQAVAPIEELAGSVPDLSDLIPGAPSIKDLVRNMLPDPPTKQSAPSTPPPVDEDDEDDYYRNARYLDGKR